MVGSRLLDPRLEIPTRDEDRAGNPSFRPFVQLADVDDERPVVGGNQVTRLRYVDPAPYSEAEFERARRFMVEWDLITPDAARGAAGATYDRLVANVI